MSIKGREYARVIPRGWLREIEERISRIDTRGDRSNNGRAKEKYRDKNEKFSFGLFCSSENVRSERLSAGGQRKRMCRGLQNISVFSTIRGPYRARQGACQEP